MMEWESFSAFGDIGELEHVCELLRETICIDAPPGAANDLVGSGSFLRKRLTMQERETEQILEQERPGLFPRTWMAHLFNDIARQMFRIEKSQGRAVGEVPGLEINLHKVLIAAHDVFDERHRRNLVAKAEYEARLAAKSDGARRAANAKHNAPGGAADLKREAWKLFDSGDYGKTKDGAATAIGKRLGVAHSTARKYLNKRPV